MYAYEIPVLTNKLQFDTKVLYHLEIVSPHIQHKTHTVTLVNILLFVEVLLY